ncbi:lamin tail domain-containing protein [Thermodesulfobacteriota bacterium]
MTVSVVVTDDTMVATVMLHYNAGFGLQSEGMIPSGGDRYEVVIPQQPDNTRVSYYIEATDEDGEITRAPESAPANAYAYTVSDTPYVLPPLFINEFLARNDQVNQDPDFNQYSDWIELYNGGGSEVDLGGMYVTDELINPTRWMIPQGTTINPYGFILIWADGASDACQIIQCEDLHTNFQLSASEGEEIGLFSSIDTGVVMIDVVTFEPQTTDVSYGRTADGGPDWGFFPDPSPGVSNE